MPEYSAKLNLEKPLGTENVNRGFFTRLIDGIDSKAGTPNGLARLDQDGNVLKADGSLAGEVTAAQFTEHKEERSSVQKAGHVQLSDAISSTDTTKAATPNAVKKAYDRANEAFLSASNGKNMLTNAITGTDPRVVIPSNPSFGQLATAVRQIQTGKKWANGSTGFSQTTVTVRGLDFKPAVIVIESKDGRTTMAYSAYTASTPYPGVTPADQRYSYRYTGGSGGGSEKGPWTIYEDGFYTGTGGSNEIWEWVAFE